MKVPFNILDFLDRAELVYGDRIGVVDEHDQPADSWGELTWREVARRARAMAAGLDALGVGRGERVAIVSQNSARMAVLLFAVPGYGRVIVPINFRLNAEEISYIVEHSGATVLLIDPELDHALSGIAAKHRFVLGRATALVTRERLPKAANMLCAGAVLLLQHVEGQVRAKPECSPGESATWSASGACIRAQFSP